VVQRKAYSTKPVRTRREELSGSLGLSCDAGLILADLYLPNYFLYFPDPITVSSPVDQYSRVFLLRLSQPAVLWRLQQDRTANRGNPCCQVFHSNSLSSQVTDMATEVDPMMPQQQTLCLMCTLSDNITMEIYKERDRRLSQVLCIS